MLRLLILSLVFMRNCSNNYYLIFLNEKASNCEKKTIGIEFELFLNLIMLTLKWCVEVDVCQALEKSSDNKLNLNASQSNLYVSSHGSIFCQS